MPCSRGAYSGYFAPFCCAKKSKRDLLPHWDSGPEIFLLKIFICRFFRIPEDWVVEQQDADDFMTDLTSADKNTFSGECVFETKASHIVFIFPHYISYLETLPIHLLKHYNSLFLLVCLSLYLQPHLSSDTDMATLQNTKCNNLITFHILQCRHVTVMWEVRLQKKTKS